MVATELIGVINGAQAMVASSGAEALELARKNRFDLVLMDMQMPGMDRLETTRAMRGVRGHKRTPIVTLTANAFDDDKARCQQAGMNDHASKPLGR